MGSGECVDLKSLLLGSDDLQKSTEPIARSC